MAPVKTVPLHGQSGPYESIPQPFGHDVGKDGVLRPMAEKHRQPRPFRGRTPLLFGEKRSRELDQSRELEFSAHDQIAGEHGPLRKAADDRVVIIDGKRTRQRGEESFKRLPRLR